MFARIPTCIVSGTKDVLTSVGHSRKMAARMPGTTLVEVHGAGHMVILEKKDRVNAALEELFSARRHARRPTPSRPGRHAHREARRRHGRGHPGARAAARRRCCAPGTCWCSRGDLGAGKTTFTQGLGDGLRVRGDVTSPTFVISRVHPSLVGGPALVHVDAYRLARPRRARRPRPRHRRWTRRSPSWSGAPAWPRRSPRTAWRSELLRAHGDETGEARTLSVTAVGPAGPASTSGPRSDRPRVASSACCSPSTPPPRPSPSRCTTASGWWPRHLGVDAMRHGELLAPAITAVLDEAWVPRQDVTAIAVGVGPGPFTGLRVGLVTARTLALALGVPVYGVCTLDVLAAQAVDAGATSTARSWSRPTPAARRSTGRRTTAGGRRLDGPVRRTTGRRSDGRAGRRRGRAALPRSVPAPVGPEHPDAGVLARGGHRRAAPSCCDPSRCTCAVPTSPPPAGRKPVS